MQADTSPEHVPLKLRERFRELERAIQETKQLLARLRELGAEEHAAETGPERPGDEARQSEVPRRSADARPKRVDARQSSDVSARLVVARV